MEIIQVVHTCCELPDQKLAMTALQRLEREDRGQIAPGNKHEEGVDGRTIRDITKMN